MANWTHAICEPCWSARNPDREPIRFKVEALDDGEEVWCCFCRDMIWPEGWAEDTGGVIYIREDPAKLSCADFHEVKAAGS